MSTDSLIPDFRLYCGLLTRLMSQYASCSGVSLTSLIKWATPNAVLYKFLFKRVWSQFAEWMHWVIIFVSPNYIRGLVKHYPQLHHSLSFRLLQCFLLMRAHSSYYCGHVVKVWEGSCQFSCDCYNANMPAPLEVFTKDEQRACCAPIVIRWRMKTKQKNLPALRKKKLGKGIFL